jgi:hypothetical protein
MKVNGRKIVTILDISDRDRQKLLAGGALNYVKHGGHRWSMSHARRREGANAAIGKDACETEGWNRLNP